MICFIFFHYILPLILRIVNYIIIPSFRLSSALSQELNRLKNGIVEERELGILYETNKLKRGLSSFSSASLIGPPSLELLEGLFVSGLTFLASFNPRKLLSAFICKQVFLTTSLYLSSDPSNSGPLLFYVGVFIMATSLGPSITTSELSLAVPHLSTLREYGPKFAQSMVSQETYDKYIGWLMKAAVDWFFIFMMIQSRWLHLYAGRSDQYDLQTLHDHHHPLQNPSPQAIWHLRPDLYHRLFLENGLWLHHLLKTRRWCFVVLWMVYYSISCNPTNRICRRIVHIDPDVKSPISLLFLNLVRRILLISNWDNFYLLKSLYLLTERPHEESN